MDSHTMPNRLGHSDRIPPSPLAQPGPSNPQACSQPQPQPHRFAHIQEVYDEKASLSQSEGTSKKPAGLTAGMSPLPGSAFPYSPVAASPLSSIPPWIRSQRPPHPRPAQLQPPFSPAPCPIASSWASPSPSSVRLSSTPYTRPRALRIANLLKPWIPIILYVMTTLGFLAAVSFWKVEVFEALDKLSLWLKSDTYLGYAVIFALIFVTTFPPVPLYSTLIILSGYTFGPWTGAIISYWASLAGALVVFTLSRTFFRASISRWLSCTCTIKRVVRAIENNPKLLFLIRLAPYPYNVMNCLLAASPSLTLRTYTLCTALSLPKLIIHTSIGSSIRSFASYHVVRPDGTSAPASASDDEGSALSHYSTAAGIVLCLAIFVYLSYITRKAVDEELMDEDALEARYAEERIAFLAGEDEASLDVEEHMVEAPVRTPITIRPLPAPAAATATPLTAVSVSASAGTDHPGSDS